MKKDELYWNLIESIVALQNDIAEEEKRIPLRDEELEHLHSTYGLVHDHYLMLLNMGFIEKEIDFDVAHF